MNCFGPPGGVFQPAEVVVFLFVLATESVVAMSVNTMKSLFVVGAGIAVLGVLCGSASAESIAITNGDFESSSSSPTGWTIDQAWVGMNASGNPGYAVQINIKDNDPMNPQAQISQTLIDTYAAGEYTLSADLKNLYYSDVYKGGMTLELIDGTTSAVLGSYTWTPTDQNWVEDVALSVSVASNSSSIGNAIKVSLVHTAKGDVCADNVALDFKAVPEPCSLAILGISAIGMIAYAWRKRR